MKVLAFSALVNALAATGLGMFVYFEILPLHATGFTGCTV